MRANIEEAPLGVLCLDSSFTKPLGHLRHPDSFRHPVRYRVLEGVDIPRLLHAPGDALRDLLLEQARQLEAEGVCAIAGSCGFMARYQAQVAEAMSVPVVLSSLTLLPWLAVVHGGLGRVGVLTADAGALKAQHFLGAGWQGSLPALEGLQDGSEFRQVILEGQRDDLDMAAMAEEVATATRRLMRKVTLDAIVLECTDLSAFVDVVRREARCPVYDIVPALDLVIRACGGSR
ncbi:aspartate/glutamate racemase family protein [Halomonas cupida]|uniref:aspartate/glutamate racemase family protein n=1 Tax=Halomonas TaxID=2745 RepID=UPI001A8F4ACA|nr:aspartate/glutamate racemase family protein [Halomonas litopenaei]